MACSICVSAQNDSIMTTKVFGGYKFYQNGEKLTGKMMQEIMVDNSEAFLMMKNARANSIVSGALGFTGGFLIGWSVGSASALGYQNWYLVGAGAAMLFISFPLSISSTKHVREAVDIYNSELTILRRQEGIQINFGIQDYGIGFALKF